MCKVFYTATFSEVFSPITIDIKTWKASKLSPTNFPEKIKYIRLERGLTQLEFSKLLNRGFSTITKWEQCLTYPKKETLIEISKILKVDYTYFLDQE